MIWVIVAIAVVLVLLAAVFIARQRRSQQLREGFGPEYDLVLSQRGDQRSAETELAERRERRDTFEIRELDPSVRADYLERWRWTQRRFVDDPAVAAAEADRLVTEVMHDRGYPVDEKFEQRAADVSVDHPLVVENYRAGWRRSGGLGRHQRRDLTQGLL
ncbi:MAG TPA: hypothetical protein VNR66_09165 [Solirubrobacteraceae bacterium]|nr:hypothetical protein [Solirubrobacteraceae bacterium]